jgi:2,3-bisphosphoglycerate-independent phosphoglycerate mutase
MEALFVTEALLKKLENNPYAFVAVNFANCDMVGHTGDAEAARKAAEVVDSCIGKLLPRLMELNAHVLITADHGNAEQMVDYVTGMTKTSHTLNDVECIYVAKDAVGTQLAPKGNLSDVAPTILALMGLPIPSDMTAHNLILGKEAWAK